ncbi:MAG: preQ(1) synthase [Armatimonadetes bacterium]|nr:preQ(1) synthase [Armatimonadota bacterium]
MPTQPSKDLETFPNPHPGREYTIEIESPEFTSLCPKTGQPDFATIHIHYVPDQRCIEMKSLKLYLWSYRNEGAFFEDLTNLILNDLVKALDPIRCRVIGDFNVRGGMKSVITAEYQREG